MEPSGAGQAMGAATGGAGATPGAVEAPRCPDCSGPVESEWRVCPDCGADLHPPHPRLTAGQAASALPSMDTGEVAFIPVHGGAKRPITFVEVSPAHAAQPTVSLTSLAVHRNEGDRTPSEPLIEEPRKPVTLVREDETVAALELPDRPRAEVTEAAAAASTTLAPTVVVMSQEAPSLRRLDPADMAEIERIVGEAVERAVRHAVALQAPAQATLLAAQETLQRKASLRVAGVGAGLLVGGAVADLVVLNWDIWVRGELVSAVGWIQQTGIIGMAAVAGAGAAALALGAAGGRRRKAARPGAATKTA